MKEKYIKLKSVLDILYANKTIDNSRIDPEAINEILALPAEEIENTKVNQDLNVPNNYDSWHDALEKLLKAPYPPQDDYWTLQNGNSYIPEHCKTCSNHPSNGGPGNCNCILGTQITY